MTSRFLSILLLMAMLANIAAPLVQRLAGDRIESFEEKAAEEGKDSKELDKKAKDWFLVASHDARPGSFEEARRTSRAAHADDFAPSDRFALTPEQPPEA